LRNDIYEPEYCCLREASTTNDEADDQGPEINAWFGPAGTLSPLHFDPKHNILVQVCKLFIKLNLKYCNIVLDSLGQRI
jgi:lysine-specific demethylase 8